MIKGIVIGFFLAIAILAGSFFYYFASGMAPVATADPPMPFEKKLANMALDAHIEKQRILQSPVPADEPNFVAPQLFRGKGVTDDPASESYWKAANGIRMTGMPAFKTNLTDTQLWQVSQLVAHANEIPESVKKVLVADVPTSGSVLAPTSASGHELVTK